MKQVQEENLESSQSRNQSVNATSDCPSAKDTNLGMHEIQIRYQLSSATMRTLCSMTKGPDRRQILFKSCLASEFLSFPLKQAERSFFRAINDHTAIPFPIQEAITLPWHKAFLLVQMDLLHTGWPNKISGAARKELYQEKGRIFSLLARILRCLVDIMGLRRDGSGANVALDVLRSVKSGVWEGAGKELLLVDGIGAVKLEKLIRSGIKSIHQLAELDFCSVERLMSRNPPFGHQLLQQLAGFPKLSCQFDVIDSHSSAGEIFHGCRRPQSSQLQLWICRIVMAYDNAQLPLWDENNPWITLVLEGEDGRLVWFWRGSVKKLTEHKELIVRLEGKHGEKIRLTLACEEIVGTVVHVFRHLLAR